MKSFATVMLLVGVMTFTSCGGDEPTPDNPLKGTWTLDYSVPYAPDKDVFQSTIKFSKDMTYEWKAASYGRSDTDKGTYEVDLDYFDYSDVFKGHVLFKSSTYGDWVSYFEIVGKHLQLEGHWYIRK